MAKFFTKSEARAAGRTRPQRLSKSAGQILAEDAAIVHDSQTFDVFLSHAFLDAELVLGVKALLESRGYRVYVDWETDQQLDRATVSSKTAEVLRKRMRQSSSLLYIATENAPNSKWMPWELGYFDGYRDGGVAILPVLDSESAEFRGQEYLGLYPVVNKDAYSDGNPDVFVQARGKGWTTLDRFAKGRHVLNTYSS